MRLPLESLEAPSGRPQPMRIVALFLAVASAIGFVVVPGQNAPAAVAAATQPATSATFAPAASGILHPDQDLVITGNITNPTGSTLSAGTATVYLDRSVVSSRQKLSDWLEADAAVPSDQLGSVVATAQTPEVPAGRTVGMSITVPAAAVALPGAASSWGARMLAVEVTGSGEPIGQSRSAIVWYPATSAPTTRIALAIPLTVPETTTGLLSAEDLQGYTGPNGVLTRELDQAIATGAAIGIDPMILASIRILNESAPASARAWLARLETAPNDSFALGYADYDLAAVSQAGAASPLVPTSFPVDPALFPGATPSPTPTPGATTPAPTAGTEPDPSPSAPPGPTLPDVATLTAFPYTITGVGWPQDDTVVEKDLDWMASGGMQTSILSSGNVAYKLDYTPSAGARIGDHGVVVSDAGISAQFRRAAASTDDISWQNAMAGLSASVATVSRERPGETRTLLATLGRGATGGNSWLAQTAAGLGSLPWSGTASLADLVATVPGSPISASVEPHPESADRISNVSALLSAEQRIIQFSSVLNDPSLLTGQQRLDLMAVLSGSRGHEAGSATTAIQSYLTTAGQLTSSVSIADSGGLLLTSTNSRISVAITNKLQWPVNVTLTVRPLNGNLHIENSSVQATIEADSQSKVQIPVEALANGQTTIEASLLSPTAVPVAQPAFLEVDVHADWETVFTAVIAVLVVLVFGFGIWRTIAKRRRGKQPAEDGDETAAAGSAEADPAEADPADADPAEAEADGPTPSETTTPDDGPPGPAETPADR